MQGNCCDLHLAFQLAADGHALSPCIAQLAVASGIIKQDGVGALYKGLSAGLLRQATYTTARLGIYQVFSDSLVKYNDGQVGRRLAVILLAKSCVTQRSPCCIGWLLDLSRWGTHMQFQSVQPMHGVSLK